jgi:NADH-quinone oxidoreductase subunit K
MMNVPLDHVLALAIILLAIGMVCVLVRRNVLFMLLGLEIMMNSAGLAFIAAGAKWHQADGQVMFLFILAVAAVEVGVGLALILLLYRRWKTLDSRAYSKLRG